MSVLFIDTETTGLDPRDHIPWEVAIIEPDGTEYVWRWRPSPARLSRADHEALAINRFTERAPEAHSGTVQSRAADDIALLLEGNVLVGSNPSFDAGMLDPWLRLHGQTPAWHYRTVCVATMAFGWLNGKEPLLDVPVPWRSDDLSRACGVEPPAGDERHTALGDARWVKRWYETLTGSGA